MEIDKNIKYSKIEKMDLITVDAQRVNLAVDIYFHWKQLDAEIRTLSGTRGINFPSEISEYLACYALGYKVNKATGGDAVDDSDPNNKRIIEIKGSSAQSLTAPNSFSPSEFFDELVFVRLEKYDDSLKIYKTGINSESIKNIKVNKSETFEEQQKQGRRPRFSIHKEIIEKYDLTPDYVFLLRDKKVCKIK